MTRLVPLFAATALLAGCTAPSKPPMASLPSPATAKEGVTRVLDPDAAAKLMANKGITLQWIDWNTRGTANVTVQDDVWHLTGAQAAAGGPGRLYVDGTITEIGRDYFLLDGTVKIDDTPDQGRHCAAHKVWHFAVTQSRPYWRLREFEWCDRLTDYVDIYF